MFSMASYGAFTLESGTAGSALCVTVDQASLAGANPSDTIPVLAAYEHELTVGDLPIGLTIERDYGSTIWHGCQRMVLGP